MSRKAATTKDKAMRRKLTTILRIFRFGLDNFRRNAWLTTAATIVMTITLLIILITLFARFVFNDTIDQVRQKIDISVYLKDEDTPNQVQKFAGELKQVPQVTFVQYISKDQARQAFEQQNKTEFSNLQALGELGADNPFPASFKIKTSDPNKLDNLNSVINKNKSLLDVSTPTSYSGERKAAIDNIANVSQFSETAGLVAAAVFVVISIMIVFNTIRMAIFNRRDEIEMMKLIGAEKLFIRGPFVVEAAMYGVLAAIVSVILLYAVLLTRVNDLSRYEIVVTNTIHFFQAWPVLIVLGQLLVGILIGVFSAQLAIRRYLKL
jgi:cell division transport system permease protein